MRRIVFLVLTASITAATHAASDEVGKISKLLERNKLEKAVETCDKLFSTAPIPTDHALREVCARADLQYALVPRAGANARAALDNIFGQWPDTEAGIKAREQAASLALTEAEQLPAGSGERRAKLEALVASYENTDCAKNAAALLRAYELEDAKNAGTLTALSDLQTRHPGTSEAEQAKRLELELAYQQALAQDSVEGWQGLMKRYPDHPRLTEVKARLVDSELRAAQAGGPEDLLAFADRHPNDARSAALRTQASRQMVSVVLSGRYGWALQQSTTPLTTVRPDVTTVYVSEPGAVDPIKAELLMIRSGERKPFEAAFASLLEQRGLSPEEAGQGSRIQWEPVGRELLVGSLSVPLCQGADAQSWWAVVTQVGGTEQIYPFRVGRPCVEDKQKPSEASTGVAAGAVSLTHNGNGALEAGGAAGPDFGTVNSDGSISLSIEATPPDRFSKRAFIVAHGEKITLTLKNTATDPQRKSNWLLVRKGSVDEVGIAGLEAGEARGYIPRSSKIIAHTRLVSPGNTDSVTFNAPPPGEYEFLSSYPGAYTLMKGTFTVR